MVRALSFEVENEQKGKSVEMLPSVLPFLPCLLLLNQRRF